MTLELQTHLQTFLHIRFLNPVQLVRIMLHHGFRRQTLPGHRSLFVPMVACSNCSNILVLPLLEWLRISMIRLILMVRRLGFVLLDMIF
jgi:hypothetical protein